MHEPQVHMVSRATREGDKRSTHVLLESRYVLITVLAGVANVGDLEICDIRAHTVLEYASLVPPILVGEARVFLSSR